MFNVIFKLLLLTIFWVQFSCTPIKTTSKALDEQSEGYIDAGNEVRLFYRIFGSGGDTVVVIHGGPGFTMDYFLHDLAPLANNHTLIFYDQRGTGRSTLVSDSVSLQANRYAEDLEAIRQHFNLNQFTLMGHSWGSAVVALYAANHPDKISKIIIVGGLPLQQHQLTEAFSKMEAGRDSNTLQKMRELREARRNNPANSEVCAAYYVLWFEPFFGNSSAANKSKGDLCAGTFESRKNKMDNVDRYTMASLGQWDWRSTLSQVKAPALVIHGTMDPLPLEGAKDWATVLPNARLLQLNDIGHFPYIEAPDRFFNAIDQFLRNNN
jgi:proline iminopeptidase